MRVGMIGTGAIAGKHAQAYKNIGYRVTVCTDLNAERGRKFAKIYGAEFVSSAELLCGHPEVDFVDVCTLPKLSASSGRVMREQWQACAGAEADGD